MNIEVRTGTVTAAFHLTNAGSLTDHAFTKDELKLIFTAISGLYSVGWMDGKHCKTVELTYSLDDINKSIAEYQGKDKQLVEATPSGAYL